LTAFYLCGTVHKSRRHDPTTKPHPEEPGEA
jgi:hypothetical protein